MIPAFLWFVDRLANSPRGGFVSGSAGRRKIQPGLRGTVIEGSPNFTSGARGALESSRGAEAIFDAAGSIDNSIDA